MTTTRGRTRTDVAMVAADGGGVGRATDGAAGLALASGDEAGAGETSADAVGEAVAVGEADVPNLALHGHVGLGYRF